MKFFVIGCGSIGQRHLRNLRMLGCTELYAYDPVRHRLDEVISIAGATPCRSVEDGLSRNPIAVFVCTPPNSHVPLAHQSVASGAHVFVEKPLSNTLNGVNELLDAVTRAGRILFVGYNLRFQRALQWAKEQLDRGAIGRVMHVSAEYGQYLPDWRPQQDYRQSYTANALMGGGIILDSSHELDYVRWLVAEVESVSCLAGKLSNLNLDVEDTADITLAMRGNVIGNVHLDCIQRGYARSCKLIGEEGTLCWDFKAGVRIYRSAGNRWDEERFEDDPNEMYMREVAHFLECVRGHAVPPVDGESGKRVLEIALAAKRSAAERRVIPV